MLLLSCYITAPAHKGRAELCIRVRAYSLRCLQKGRIGALLGVARIKIVNNLVSGGTTVIAAKALYIYCSTLLSYPPLRPRSITGEERQGRQNSEHQIRHNIIQICLS
jgi:hypothetical protein